MKWFGLAIGAAITMSIGFWMQSNHEIKLNAKLEKQRNLIAQGVNVWTASEDDCQALAKALKLENYVCWVKGKQ